MTKGNTLICEKEHENNQIVKIFSYVVTCFEQSFCHAFGYLGGVVCKCLLEFSIVLQIEQSSLYHSPVVLSRNFSYDFLPVDFLRKFAVSSLVENFICVFYLRTITFIVTILHCIAIKHFTYSASNFSKYCICFGFIHNF